MYWLKYCSECNTNTRPSQVLCLPRDHALMQYFPIVLECKRYFNWIMGNKVWHFHLLWLQTINTYVVANTMFRLHFCCENSVTTTVMIGVLSWKTRRNFELSIYIYVLGCWGKLSGALYLQEARNLSSRFEDMLLWRYTSQLSYTVSSLHFSQLFSEPSWYFFSWKQKWIKLKIYWRIWQVICNNSVSFSDNCSMVS